MSAEERFIDGEKNKETGLVVLWVKLKEAGYTRTYPGEKVQVDVKFVPIECLTQELREVIEKIKKDFIMEEYSIV